MTILRFLLILLLMLNALAFAALRGWLGQTPAAGEPERVAAQLHPDRIRLANERVPEPVTPESPSDAVAAEVAMPSAVDPAAADPRAIASAAADSSATDAETAVELPGTPAPEAPATEALTDTSTPPAASGEDVSGAPAGEAQAPLPGADEVAAGATANAADAPTTQPANEPAPAADAAPPTVCHAWARLTPDQADRLAQRLRRIGATPARTRTETPDSWWVRIPPQRSQEEAERRVVELNLLGVSDMFIVREPGPTQYAVSLGVFKTEDRARVLLGQLRGRGVTNAGIEPRTTTTYRIQASIPAGQLRTVESAAPGLRARRQACAQD